MNNHLIVKYLLLDKYYSKYYNTVINLSSIKYNNKLLYKILLCVKHLKDEYAAETNTIPEIVALFEADYPALSEDDKALAEAIFTKAAGADVSEGLVDSLFESFVQKAQAERIAETAIEVTQGRKDWKDLEKLFTLDSNAESANDEDFLDTSLEGVYEKEDSVEGLRWRLNTLNKILGPLRVGDFGFIFARPEVGKTTFLASEVTFLGTQTEQPVLWVNNEQRGTAVLPRCYAAYFGVTEEEIRKDIGRYSAEWEKVFGGRFLFVDNPGITRARLEAIMRQHNPGLIVFDQLDKVNGFDAERYDLLMKAKYQWAREMAKKYGPVIGICQAGGSAENKRYLDMTDVDSSYTAKQGEADWMIGIGKTNDDGLQRVRYLSFCKNKMPPHPDKDEGLRHTKVEVFINEPIARYEDKIRF